LPQFSPLPLLYALPLHDALPISWKEPPLARGVPSPPGGTGREHRVNRLSTMSLGNRALVLLITLAVLFFGAFAAASAKRELFPEMDLPMVMVSAGYNGATPQVVEGQVTEPLEQAVQGAEGVHNANPTYNP